MNIERKMTRIVNARENLMIGSFVVGTIAIGVIVYTLAKTNIHDSQETGVRILMTLGVLAIAIIVGYIVDRLLKRKLKKLVKQKRSSMTVQ